MKHCTRYIGNWTNIGVYFDLHGKSTNHIQHVGNIFAIKWPPTPPSTFPIVDAHSPLLILPQEDLAHLLYSSIAWLCWHFERRPFHLRNRWNNMPLRNSIQRWHFFQTIRRLWSDSSHIRVQSCKNTLNHLTHQCFPDCLLCRTIPMLWCNSVPLHNHIGSIGPTCTVPNDNHWILVHVGRITQRLSCNPSLHHSNPNGGNKPLPLDIHRWPRLQSSIDHAFGFFS